MSACPISSIEASHCEARRIEEIEELAAAEPWTPVGESKTIPGPLYGLWAEMKSLEVSRVGELRPPRVLANAVLLGIVTPEESQSFE